MRRSRHAAGPGCHDPRVTSHRYIPLAVMPRKHAVAVTAAAAATALVLAAVTLPVLAQSSGAAPVTDGPIQISELLAVPVRNASGATPPAPRSWADVTAVVEWVELSNTGTAAADVSGWTVKEGGVDGASWRLPDNVALPTGGFLVLLCPDDDAPGGGAGRCVSQHYCMLHYCTHTTPHCLRHCSLIMQPTY